MTETIRKNVRACYALCGALAIGSIGPWATFGPFSKGGLDGDGILTLLLAAIAAVLIWRWSGRPARGKLIGLVIAGVLASAITVYDTVDVEGAASLGWGLILALIASIGLAIVSVRLLRSDPPANAS